MIKVKLWIFLLSIACLLPFKVLGQEDCAFTLSKAQKLYDAGTIEQIPEMLKMCMESGFTKEEKQQAMKLIIMAYLFDNNQKEADKEMLKFLKEYPEYEIVVSDQAEFVQLFNTYRTLPIASIGLVGFTNMSYVTPISYYGTDGNKGSYKNTGFGFQVGLSYLQYLMEYIDLNVEGFYVSSTYQFASSDTAKQITFEETQSKLEFPISAVFKPRSFGMFVPYCRLGFGTSLLLSSNGSETTINPASMVKPNSNPSFDLMNRRKKFQIYGIIGAGVRINLSHSFLLLDVRYNQGFTQQFKKSARTSGDYINYVINTQHNENDFRINNLWMPIGFYYKFYKPQKR